jgi:chemotaxis protein MotA
MADDENGNRAAQNAFDPATLIGLAGALGLVVAALYLGGAPQAFVAVPSILIVIGGTTLLTMASFTVTDMGVTAGPIFRTVSYHGATPRRCDGFAASGRRGAARRLLSLQSPLTRAKSAIPCCARG